MADDPLLDLVKFVSTRVGGKPGTQKWEVVTAVFGWAAAAALTGWLAASLLGYDGWAGRLFAVFVFVIGIALQRDPLRIFAHGV